MDDAGELRRRVAACSGWYHVLDLPFGVTTPGLFDMAPHLDALGLPARVDGLDVVDVGASDGFFSFELERRGARRVVSVELPSVLDHEAPRWARDAWRAARTPDEVARTDRRELEERFELARDALRSRVVRERCAVADLGARLPSAFDLAFSCNLLQHVRDPANALENLRETLRPGGRLIVAAPCDLRADGSYAVLEGTLEPHLTWWTPSPAALRRLSELAGFEDVEWHGTFELPRTDAGATGTIGVLHARAPAGGAPRTLHG